VPFVLFMVKESVLFFRQRMSQRRAAPGEGLLRLRLKGIVMEETGPKAPVSGNRWDRVKSCIFLHCLKDSEIHQAWCRTGIALIVFSFVIERFDLLIRELRFMSASPEKFVQMEKTHYLSLITFILGAFIILLAGWRFFDLRRHINRGESDFSTLPDVFLLTSILLTLTMVFFLFVLLY